MKFAIFLQHYFPYGGLQRDALRLCESAIDLGDSPTLVVSTWSGPKPKRVPIMELHSGGISNHQKAARFAKDCQSLIQSKKFDSSISFSRVPGSAFQFCGDPCLAEKIHRDKPRIAHFLPRYRFILGNESAVFGPSSQTHLFFLAQSEIPAFQKHYSIPPERITLLPPWLKKPEVFAESPQAIKSQFLQEQNLPSDADLLLFVGSDFKRKGLDRAIAALATIKNTPYHLIVCGLSEASDFQKQAQQLGCSERVHFLGPRDDIPRLMTAASMLIHPARQETAGMVLLEALTHGLPVLCTENCGYATHVQEAGCPLLKKDESSKNISEGIVNLAARIPALKEQIKKWADDPSRHHTANLILDKIRQSF